MHGKPRVFALILMSALAATPLYAQQGSGGPPSPNITTQKIFDETALAPVNATVDVSGFKEIRIVARCTAGYCVAGSGQIFVTPFVVYGENEESDVVQLGEGITAGPVGGSAVYALPGQKLRIRIMPSFGSGGRVVIYGRSN